jgi:hypothetical protein
VRYRKEGMNGQIPDGPWRQLAASGAVEPSRAPNYFYRSGDIDSSVGADLCIVDRSPLEGVKTELHAMGNRPGTIQTEPAPEMPDETPGERLPVVHSAAQAQQLASFLSLGRSMTGF